MRNKNKKKGRIIAVFAGVVAFALFTSVLVSLAVYNVTMRPAEFEFVPPTSGDGVGYYRHAYDDLNEDEKKVYSVILRQVYSQPERIEIPSLGNGNLENIFQALSFDNPDLFNLGTDCKVYAEGQKTYFETDYKLGYEEYRAMLEEVNGIAAAIVSEASSYSSVYEKEKYVHDYIINHCSYVEPENSKTANTVYGCLVEGRASCEGYSRAFQYILSALNIDNRLVTGESADDGVNYVNHMWNYVILDGSGYFVDLTWDDPRTEGNVLRHTYFNVTTEEILLKHRNIQQSLPLCNDTKYNYFVYENLYLDVGAGDDFATFVSNAVNSSVQANSAYVEMRFSDSTVMQQAKETLFNTGVIYEVYKNAGLVDGSTAAQVYYSSDEQMNTLCLFL